MNDLETAKTLLYGRRLTLVIVKKDKTLFESRLHGISGFLGAIDQLGKEIEDASIADKVAGKAVALLCLYARIRAIYAETMSIQAKDLFEKNGIVQEWKRIVDKILDKKKSNSCPFENEARDISNPIEAYQKLNTLRRNLRQCK